MAYHNHPGETAAAALPLKDAAARMGISVSALRGRLKRGTVEGGKDEDGRILVYLPSSGHRVEPDGGDEAAVPEPDVAAPLNQLIEAIQVLHGDLANQDASLEHLMTMHRQQFETNSSLDSQIREMSRQIDTLHTAVKTMGAAFRVHAQETDRLIKALGRGNGTAAPAPAFTPPAQKQRLFGRRQSDQDDTPSSDPAES